MGWTLLLQHEGYGFWGQCKKNCCCQVGVHHLEVMKDMCALILEAIMCCPRSTSTKKANRTPRVTK